MKSLSSLKLITVIGLISSYGLVNAAEPPRPNVPTRVNANVLVPQLNDEPLARNQRPPARPMNRELEQQSQPILSPQISEQLNNFDLDGRLNQIIEQADINVQPLAERLIPNINDALPQLGKALFFAKNLAGQNDTACVTCHHPVLGGGDSLSLPVGVAAVNALGQEASNLLGHGRFNGTNEVLATVPRNSPTVFNIALNDRGLFWDSRVEVIGPVERGSNGVGQNITTPDSLINNNGLRLADANISLMTSLPAAQARFPVTSSEEMRNEFSLESDNQTLRSQLASRFDNSDDDYQSNWLPLFSQAYPDGEVNFNRIAEALGEYQRSMTFVNNPWFNYLQGDVNAMSDEQKRGAILFFTPANQGGAGCVMCHSGDTFSDNRHHLVAFPQMGVGKGNDSGAESVSNTADFGRENVSLDNRDRYHFRTPGLLNIALTAPYGHAGTYQTLEDVVRHYNNPRAQVERFFGIQAPTGGNAGDNNDIAENSPFCQLPQIAEHLIQTGNPCQSIYPDAVSNSLVVVERLQQGRQNNQIARSPLRAMPRLNNVEVNNLVAFLHALTDSCTMDRDCLEPWIVDGDNIATFPDNNPLVAENAQGDEL